MPKKIDKLIINSPHVVPEKYWTYDRNHRTFELVEGRRPAGYVVATPGSQSFDDPGVFKELPLVNKIRKRVDEWRENNYPGVTNITRRLLEHWRDEEERIDKKFFFCQLEAIETIIWLTEASPEEKVGIQIPSDGGDFQRICSKMATGSGKTVVMSMLIAWQILNKVTSPRDTRFSKNIFVVAPGLTVKSRLQVLNPDNPDNYYSEFNVVPVNLYERLREGNIIIENWHTLAWETEEQLSKKKTVDKRGEISDLAYTKGVLGDMSKDSNILVINDEAHHAWRVQKELKIKREFEEQANEATVWISGLDRINRTVGILNCYDFSATPFAPSGKRAEEENLFGWIVSDFGLNDAIESGLVKTPRVVIRDDGKIDVNTFKSKLYHLYKDDSIKFDVNRKAEPSEPLPDLLINAYYLLGKDWLETKKLWEESGKKVPPVMITVANRIETASRIKHAFDHKEIQIPELCDKTKTLQIDSKVLQEAESKTEELEIIQEDGLTKDEQAELLRKTVDTVGEIGEPGEQIQNIISVGMLSEGWDAKTVTHIMGLRAFSSQLLCEQVVGRGLRRTSYDVDPETGLYDAEYVNIFGVPFTFLPHEGGEGAPPSPAKPRTQIEPDLDKKEHEISWPNTIRVEHVYKNSLNINVDEIPILELDAQESITEAELAAIIGGKPNERIDLSKIDLREIANSYRTQTIVFETAKRIFNAEKDKWENDTKLFPQLINVVSQFLESDKIKFVNTLMPVDENARIVLTLVNMNKIINFVWNQIRIQNTEKLVPVFDPVKPISSTSDMKTWYTSRPCEYTKKSHINFAVYDSSWEASEGYLLDKTKLVDSWVKNDHLGFDIYYNYGGVVRRYIPDFIVKLSNGEFLVIETKGVDSLQNKAKRDFLDEWVRAINEHGGFGKWNWLVSFHPSDLLEKIESLMN